MSDNDLRVTPEREAVLEVLAENIGAHPSAEDIYLATMERHPGIGLATVYRTLDALERVGIVSKLELGASGSRYELNTDVGGHFHHHLICIGCGRITEFNQDLLEHLEKEIEDSTGFQITDHSLRFYGYCAKCREAAKGGETSRS
ncbi:MAG TPA: transcriptional repressor [Firmicutes bacterium]|nr:transcriptional repressor [Bacillota bacterium]